MLNCLRLSAVGVIGLAASAACAQRSIPVQVAHPVPVVNDSMGMAVALDGDTMAVGVPQDDVNINVDQGSVQVYHWTGNGWALEATLVAGDGASGDGFGSSLSIHRDTIVVGAPQDDVAGNLNQGGAYVFVRSGTTWVQQAKLAASDGASADRFGWSVAVHDDMVVVGAPFDDVGVNADQGSASVFSRAGTGWSAGARVVTAEGVAGDQFGVSVAVEADTLVVGATAYGADGAAFVFDRAGSTWIEGSFLSGEGNIGDGFGSAVAISGDTIAVGAFGDDVGGNANQGSVHVFTRSGLNWFQQTQLFASDGGLGDTFGCAVSLDGDRLLVGAYGDSGTGGAAQGSAYVYARSLGVWSEQAKLVDPAPLGNDWFGYGVALDGDVAVVGKPQGDVGALSNAGAGVVFTSVAGLWIGGAENVTGATPSSNEQFGTSIACDGSRVVVGSPGDVLNAVVAGTATVYRRSGSTLIPEAVLSASDGASNDFFGDSVAVSGDTVAVGASRDNNGAVLSQGSVYIFVKSGSNWVQQAKLLAPDGLTREFFGCAVALEGDTLIVGADGDTFNSITDTGQVYVFQRSGTAWNFSQRLDASDASPADLFGCSLAISGDTVVIGARGAGATGRGAAYVFQRSGGFWSETAVLSSTVAQFFGLVVAIDGDTVVVGAEQESVQLGSEGAAYVYGRSGTAWPQQTKLVSPTPTSGERFGSSVAIDGGLIAVGARGRPIGPVSGIGGCYLFAKPTSSWIYRDILLPRTPAASDGFGSAIALDGSTVVMGAALADPGGFFSAGAVALFNVPADDYSFANINSGFTTYSSLGGAMQAASTGSQIVAGSAAFRAPGVVDTLGRTMLLRAGDSVRMDSASVLALAGGSGVALPQGSSARFFGQVRATAGASSDIYADSFRVGARGTLTVRSGASLSINAPASTLDGQTRTETDSFLNFGGSTSNYGPFSAASGTTISASGTFVNFDTLSMTTGSISAPLTVNRGAANLFGTCVVFGSYDNRSGAVTTIRSGTMFVYGSLSNSGTIVGTLCSNCLGGPPNLDIGGTLSLGAGANLNMPYIGSLVRVGGGFDCEINNNARFDLVLATLQLDGAGGAQAMEVMSADIGPDPAGLDRSLPGHFPIGELHIGPGPAIVEIVDAHDNDNAGQLICEALYVDTLRIDPGSRLVNRSCRIYYNQLVNAGSVDSPENLIPLRSLCPADFNGDGGVDSDDVIGFFGAWDASDTAADFNHDGGVDSDDVIGFFANWDAGC